MFNKMLTIVGKMIYKKPTVHTNPPKMIVSYFSNSIVPTAKVFNIANISYFNLSTSLKKKEGSADVYALNLEAQYLNEKEITVYCLGEFETKKEAENALNLLLYKLYSPLKGFYKTLATIIVILVVGVIGTDMIRFSQLSSSQISMREQAQAFHNLPQESQKQILESQGLTPQPQVPAQPVQAPINPAAPALSEAELKALFEEASRLTQEANQAAGNTTPPNVGETPQVAPSNSNPQYPLSPGDAFLSGL